MKRVDTVPCTVVTCESISSQELDNWMLLQATAVKGPPFLATLACSCREVICRERELVKGVLLSGVAIIQVRNISYTKNPGALNCFSCSANLANIMVQCKYKAYCS